MRIQRVTRGDGVRERYVPGVGATPPAHLPRRLRRAGRSHPRHHQVSRRYLAQILNASALDTNRIGSASFADSYRIRDRYHTLHRQEIFMSKLKLEHGVSRIRRAKLQSSIDQTVADDIELLAQWSNNETNYVINELLRFALTQEEDFQKYKASSAANAARPASSTKPATTPIKPASEPAAKPDATASPRIEEEYPSCVNTRIFKTHSPAGRVPHPALAGTERGLRHRPQQHVPHQHCESVAAPDRVGTACGLSRIGLELRPVPVFDAVPRLLHDLLAAVRPSI